MSLTVFMMEKLLELLRTPNSINVFPYLMFTAHLMKIST